MEQIFKIIEMANQAQNCSSILIAWKMGHIRMMGLACRNMASGIRGKSKMKDIICRGVGCESRGSYLIDLHD